MKLVKTLLASVALAATMGANAAITGSLGGGYGTFLSLSAPGSCVGGCTLGGIGTISGGSIEVDDLPFADIPAGAIFENRFLAAGPTSGSPSTISFGGGGVDYISFLWGSPDIYNRLTVVGTESGSNSFTASSLSFAVTNGDQSFSQYVQFSGSATDKIVSLIFMNDPSVNAFETANYSITPIPEPETYALMLAGLGAMGFVARRRKKA